MDRYRLFRKDRKERKAGGCPFCMKEQHKCMGTRDWLVGSLWVKIR